MNVCTSISPTGENCYLEAEHIGLHELTLIDGFDLQRVVWRTPLERNYYASGLEHWLA